MSRTEHIAWHPETMTKAEHRAEALRLMGRARRPQRPGEAPVSRPGVTHFLLSAQLHLALSTDPLTPDERDPEDIVDAHVEESEETGEYRSGWHDCMTMRKLHDMFPGFAITRPREQDPFELNRRILGQHGIYTAQDMYAAAAEPYHQRPHIADDALPTTSDGSPAGD